MKEKKEEIMECVKCNDNKEKERGRKLIRWLITCLYVVAVKAIQQKPYYFLFFLHTHKILISFIIKIDEILENQHGSETIFNFFEFSSISLIDAHFLHNVFGSMWSKTFVNLNCSFISKRKMDTLNCTNLLDFTILMQLLGKHNKKVYLCKRYWRIDLFQELFHLPVKMLIQKEKLILKR